MGLAMFGLSSSPLVEELFTKENVQILKIKKFEFSATYK